MKFTTWILFIGLLIAFASAGVIPQEEYLPPATEVEQPAEEPATLADDGYRYKTVRKLRHRRDVSELLASGVESAVLADDGYHYRAPEPTDEVLKVSSEYLPPQDAATDVKEVSEAPQVSSDYLPPVEVAAEISLSTVAPFVLDVPQVPQVPQESNEYLPPVDDSEVVEGPAESAVLADDGYHYKAGNGFRFRRDVSEIVASSNGYMYEAPAATDEVVNIYLPPAEVKQISEEANDTPANEYLPPVVEAKEVREVSPANAYLPPASELKEAPEVSPANVYLPPATESKEVPETAELAEDGYHFKTVRRLKYHQRRDVSHIIAPESAVLADDGYHYKVPEESIVIPKTASEYLPPANEVAELKENTEAPTEAPIVTEAPTTAEAPKVSNEYLPPVEEVPELKEGSETPQETAILADDGYHYKIGNGFRFRRDVSEIVASSNGYRYEAPAEVANIYLPPTEVKQAIEEPTEPAEVANEYLPPVAEVKEAPEVIDAPAEVPDVYLPPVAEAKVAPESAVLDKDGYHYKTVRRLKYRHRRDVSHIIASESAVLADDGYHYRVPEESAVIPKVSNEYLPPSEEVAELKESTEAPTEAPTTTEDLKVSNEYLPPVEEVPQLKEASEIPEETAVLADDGYHYKTGNGFRFRRDVSEIVASSNGYKYLPPVEVKQAIEKPTEAPVVANEYLPPVADIKKAPEIIDAPAEIANVYLPPVAEVKEAPESAVLAEDRTVRDLEYRHRRDVSHIIAPESAVLADDGYHYRIPEESAIIPKVSNEYLPPSEQVAELNVATEAPTEAPVVTEAPTTTEAPKISNEYLPPSEEVPELKEASEVPEETAVLAEDGYHYKTGNGFRYRRDVSHIFASESAVLADDGYHYKVPEESSVIPKISNEYLPPAEDVAEVKAAPDTPIESDVVTEVPEATEASKVSNDYLPPVEDVAELKVAIDAPTEAPLVTEAPKVSNEYLPPVEDVPESKEASEVPEETAVFAEDGYHYKTGNGFRFRRDVSEIVVPKNAPNGYFYSSPVREAVEAPADDSAVLADDGYHYKTVRRIRYRHRRDVSHVVNAANNGYVYEAPAASEPIANEYLPPAEEAAEVKTVEAEPTDAAPEVANEYLPPAEETVGEAEIVEAPQLSAVLADDGYRYKTVRRIRYRHRRDVSHVVNAANNGYVYEAPAASEPIANEYLPPAEEAAEVKTVEAEPTDAAPEVANEYLPPAEETVGEAEIVEAPQYSAVLADDGYRYKTVRRLKYRHRRDVSEIVAAPEGYAYNAPAEDEPQVEYLPPAEQVAEIMEATEVPQESAALADDGYRYKTVKRIRYRY